MAVVQTGCECLGVNGTQLGVSPDVTPIPQSWDTAFGQGQGINGTPIPAELGQCLWAGTGIKETAQGVTPIPAEPRVRVLPLSG